MINNFKNQMRRSKMHPSTFNTETGFKALKPERRTAAPDVHEGKKMHSKENQVGKIEILYEDEYLVIINKPSGLLSVGYSGSNARNAADMLEQMMRKKGTYSNHHKPFPVHRLDRDTSGVMMFALSETAQKKIMDTWQDMVKSRKYRAVTENPRPGDRIQRLAPQGLIDDPLAYNAHNIAYVPHQQKTDQDEKNSKPVKTVTARTNYRIIASGKKYSLFELELDTGRKNQIRAHLSNRGYPIAGDPNYRSRSNPFGSLALHARTLSFIHPYTEKKMTFEVPEPEEWQRTVEYQVKTTHFHS